MKQPELNCTISPGDSQSYYWLKNELVAFCRDNGIGAADLQKQKRQEV